MSLTPPVSALHSCHHQIYYIDAGPLCGCATHSLPISNTHARRPHASRRTTLVQARAQRAVCVVRGTRASGSEAVGEREREGAEGRAGPEDS